MSGLEGVADVYRDVGEDSGEHTVNIKKVYNNRIYSILRILSGHTCKCCTYAYISFSIVSVHVASYLLQLAFHKPIHYHTDIHRSITI